MTKPWTLLALPGDTERRICWGLFTGMDTGSGQPDPLFPVGQPHPRHLWRFACACKGARRIERSMRMDASSQGSQLRVWRELVELWAKHEHRAAWEIVAQAILELNPCNDIDDIRNLAVFDYGNANEDIARVRTYGADSINIKWLPEVFGTVRAPNGVSLFRVQLERLPWCFAYGTYGMSVNIGGNPLRELPENFMRIKVTDSLCMKDTLLEALPELAAGREIGYKLDISGNYITTLHPSLANLTSLGCIVIGENLVDYKHPGCLSTSEEWRKYITELMPSLDPKAKLPHPTQILLH